MKQLLFLIFLCFFLLIQAQNDSLNFSLPKTQWLSEDSLFLATDSLPKLQKDSVLVVKKDTVLAPKTPLLAFKYIHIEGISDSKRQKNIRSDAKNIKDTLMLQNAAQTWAFEAKKKGEYEFSLDKYLLRHDTLLLFFFEGKKYITENIIVKDLPISYLQKYGIEKILKKQQVLAVAEVEAALKKCVYEYQTIGYPFAHFQALPTTFRQGKKDTLFTTLHYQFLSEKNFVIDSLIFIGKKKEKNPFLYSMIRLAPQDAYNQEALDNVQKILNNSIYFKNVKPPIVTFSATGKSKIKIPLEAKRANKFDVLVGVLPPSNTTNNTDQRFQWTGTSDLALVSLVGYGESIQLKLEKLTLTSRRVNMKINVPYIARLPLQANVEFELQQQNIDFLNVRGAGGGEYGFSPFLSVKAQYKYKRTSITDSLRNTIILNKRKPQVLDGSQTLYNVGFKYENLDYRFSPKKGLWATLDLGIGQKIIKKDTRLPAAIFDTLLLSQPTLEGEIWLKGYFPISKRGVIHLANRTYYLDQQKIYQSDQTQLGGGRSLRGFNENQFFADAFTSFTGEYRFILEQNSFLFVFCDYGILRDNVIATTYKPLGLGLGMNYETPAGIVSFSYAVGKVGDIAFQPARGKIHVGLVSQF